MHEYDLYSMNKKTYFIMKKKMHYCVLEMYRQINFMHCCILKLPVLNFQTDLRVVGMKKVQVLNYPYL